MRRIFYGLILLVLLSAGLPGHTAQAASEEWIAYTGQDGNVYLVHPDGSGSIRITMDARIASNAENEPGGRVSYDFLRWSPDGRRLGLIRTSGQVQDNRLVQTTMVQIYDVEKGSLRPLGEGPASFAWNPDSSALVYHLQTNWKGASPQEPLNGIWQMNASTGQKSELVPAQNGYSLVSPEYSPDGRYLTFREVRSMEGLGPFAYVDTRDNSYHVWDQKGDPDVGAHSWTPDGAALVFDKNLYIIQPGERIWKIDPQRKDASALTSENAANSSFRPQVSPSGDRILYLSGEGQDRPVSIWVMGLDGSNPRALYGPEDNIYLLSWASDGQRAVFSDGPYGSSTVRVLDVDSGKSSELARGFLVEWQPRPSEAAAASPQPAATAAGSSQPTSAAVQPTEEMVQAVPLTEQPIRTITAAPPPASPPNRPTNLVILAGGLCLGGMSLLVVIAALVFGRRKG